jgi:serine/threonine protein kinase
MPPLRDEQETQWSSRDPSPGEDPPVSKRIVREPGELSKEVHAGELVGGRYRIGRQIGAGAMGTVFEAREANLDRKVAIKFLKPDALGDANAVARFFVEARSAAQLVSDYAVRVYGVDTLENGAPYIIMEYLEGCDLAEWLTRRKTAPVSQAVEFILQACDALDEAHRRGIIHRDVKPANLFAVDRGSGPPRIKVLDFGISKMEAIVSDTLPPEMSGPAVAPTQRSAIFGSFPYMSPEQMESARGVDRRTDIWSLGVTLWELLGGERPFRAGSLVALHSTIMSGLRPRLRELRPEVSPELDAVLLRCLAPSREDRYATVEDLMRALKGVPWTIGSTLVSSARAEDSPRTSTGRDAPQPRPRGGAWWKVPILSVVFLAFPFFLFRSRHAEPAGHLDQGAGELQRPLPTPAPKPSAVLTVSTPPPPPIASVPPTPSENPSPAPPVHTNQKRPPYPPKPKESAPTEPSPVYNPPRTQR